MREQLFVYVMRLCFTLEVHEEHLFKVLVLNQAFIVTYQLVQLLLQVIKDSVVHHISIDLCKHLILCQISLSDLLKVVMFIFAAHGQGSFLPTNFFLLSFTLEPFRQLKCLIIG